LKGKKMKVEIFRLAGQPVTIEVKENGTIRDVFSHPDSGKVIGRDGSLLEAAEDVYGSIEALGNLRVNGSAATLDTRVTAGSTILIIPKVEGGVV
jgi:molybdopterin converting factor small subunit